MKKLFVTLLICGAVLYACQRQPEPAPSLKELPMTESNLAKIRTSTELTGDEIVLIQQYMITEIIVNDGEIDSTITIGKAIELQRQREKNEPEE